ncbi:MAG: DUF59 domain-containing protein [Chloroflexi bacterium]|nr:DUF59 domain-containing protein [Chloroflexota bacterium]
MVTQEQIRETLKKVLVPGTRLSLFRLNLVRDVTVSDEKVNITLASAALDPAAQDWLKTKVSDVIQELRGVKDVEVSFVDAKPTDANEIRSVIAVMSGVISDFDSLASVYDAWFENEGKVIFDIEVQAFQRILPLLPKPCLAARRPRPK